MGRGRERKEMVAKRGEKGKADRAKEEEEEYCVLG